MSGDLRRVGRSRHVRLAKLRQFRTIPFAIRTIIPALAEVFCLVLITIFNSV
ncbi:hypothetical protein HGO38_15375 [Rhizobium sp. CG5]|uniref:hypothetical protein n=1 Tax=Rhizobium sp. CG5 TaxID=2726076 RepID=UPI002033CCD1|nr:hypothetical protein [Rhizobium sp. CG5]MCM2474861.1 hypothetical protein [Rhizobium sp. CG5]